MAGRLTAHAVEQVSAGQRDPYSLNQWEAPNTFAHDGRAEIDNNAVERSLRAVAIGRKNCLFAGSESGGERTAAIYSLIGSAKLPGVEPESNLRDILAPLAEHPVNQIDDLLPWNIDRSILPQT